MESAHKGENGSCSCLIIRLKKWCCLMSKPLSMLAALASHFTLQVLPLLFPEKMGTVQSHGHCTAQPGGVVVPPSWVLNKPIWVPESHPPFGGGHMGFLSWEHSLLAHGEFFLNHHSQALFLGLLSVPSLPNLQLCLGTP